MGASLENRGIRLTFLVNWSAVSVAKNWGQAYGIQFSRLTGFPSLTHLSREN